MTGDAADARAVGAVPVLPELIFGSGPGMGAGAATAWSAAWLGPRVVRR
ncbi:hypothetical protein [Streptomyces sp. NPDC015125]